MRENDYSEHHLKTPCRISISFCTIVPGNKEIMTIVIKNICDNLLKLLIINAHDLFGFVE